MSFVLLQFPQGGTGSDLNCPERVQYALFMAMLVGLTHMQDAKTCKATAASLAAQALAAYPLGAVYECNNAAKILVGAVNLSSQPSITKANLGGLYWMLSDILAADAAPGYPSRETQDELLSATLALRDILLGISCANFNSKVATSDRGGSENEAMARATLGFRSLQAHYMSDTARPCLDRARALLQRMLEVGTCPFVHPPVLFYCDLLHYNSNVHPRTLCSVMYIVQVVSSAQASLDCKPGASKATGKPKKRKATGNVE